MTIQQYVITHAKNICVTCCLIHKALFDKQAIHSSTLIFQQLHKTVLSIVNMSVTKTWLKDFKKNIYLVFGQYNDCFHTEIHVSNDVHHYQYCNAITIM
jgi:hypothetical protein